METALIPVRNELIGGETIQAVNARELYNFLDVESNFSTWMNRRIEEGAFIEGQDFLPKKEEIAKGRPPKGYIISLDMAKHLCMLERNDKGKQARQYFVECEKKLRQIASAPASELEVLHRMTGAMLEQSRQLAEVKTLTEKNASDLRELAAHVNREEEHFTILAWARLHGMNIDRKTGAALGMKARVLSKKNGYTFFPVKDVRWGTVNAYHQDILAVVCSDWMRKGAAA